MVGDEGNLVNLEALCQVDEDGGVLVILGIEIEHEHQNICQSKGKKSFLVKPRKRLKQNIVGIEVGNEASQVFTEPIGLRLTLELLNKAKPRNRMNLFSATRKEGDRPFPDRQPCRFGEGAAGLL